LTPAEGDPPAPPNETRKQRQLHTRARLMQAAVSVFARHGTTASIDDVAAEAGFTKGAFYANFASKEALFLAMLDERFSERLAQLRCLTASGGELEVQAREAGAEFATYLESAPDWQRLFFDFVAQAARDEPFRVQLVDRYRGLREGMTAVFQRRAAELELPSPVTMSELALMTFAMANGFALERLLEPEAAPQELFSTMLVIFFAGLQALAKEASPLGSRTSARSRR
jgi:AcrR family transcriptional regulator